MIEGDLLHQSLDPEPERPDADRIPNLKRTRKKNRETSEEVRDEIFTCERQDSTSDSGSGENIASIDMQGLEDKKSSNYPDDEIGEKTENRQKASDHLGLDRSRVLYLIKQHTHEAMNHSRHEKNT